MINAEYISSEIDVRKEASLMHRLIIFTRHSNPWAIILADTNDRKRDIHYGAQWCYESQQWHLLLQQHNS